MFEIKPDARMSTEEKLLYNIQELLNSLLSNVELDSKAKHQEPENNVPGDDLNSLKRGELMAMVKELPEKPQGWTKLSNEELKKLMKKGRCD